MSNMNKMITRLDKIVNRYNELGEQLMLPEVMKDNRTMAKLAKEQSSLTKVVDKYEEYKKVASHLKEALELLKENDPEIKEMAELEISELEPQKEQIIEELEVLLIPKDPNDDNNAIVEIRGAAGGDEGNIFAGDLYRMYTRYAETVGWKVELLETVESEAGGFSLISFIAKGEGVYGKLKFESGSHRVQRVPKTETQGRIHTSTATVLVLPEVDEVEVEINPNDLVIEFHRASGAGGQHVNKTDSAVRITHIPTGATVNCQDGRSQHDNKANALRIIRSRIYEAHQQKLEEERSSERRSKMGTGDRSEKIRTYNYPQNRVTDHRIGLTIQQLDRIVEGKLDDIIDALIKEDQLTKLAGEHE